MKYTTQGLGKTTQYQKQKARKRFRARAGIEPEIGHIKHDHRMLRNFLKGELGDQFNAVMAGTALNLKKKLNRIKKQILFVLFLQFQLIWSEKRVLCFAPDCGVFKV